MDTIENLIDLSIEVSRFVVGAEGNTSAKVANGFFIKKSGTSLKHAITDNFILCDYEGNPYYDNVIPSIEVTAHAVLYRKFSVNFIAHTHPTHTMKVICSEQAENFASKRLFPDQVVYNGAASCIIEYHHPGKLLAQGLERGLDKYLDNYNQMPSVILLRNHGIITLGTSITECIVSTEICEKSAEIFLGSLFAPKYLSDEEVKQIKNDKKEKWRQEIISRR